jgi:hypothetical protein
MKKFVVERNFPGAANFSIEELQAISQSFCEGANNLGTSFSWIQSFITDDKIYCLQFAESEQIVREHSKIARFPINTVSEVKTIIDPTTSNAV